jgi:tetratricopeptide (TPR) repeat protein
MAGKSKDSFEYLGKALELGESSGNQKVVGYACTWLPWACAELGLFAEGIAFGERAQKIAELFPSDQYLFFKSLAGLCYINFMKGDTKRIFKGAKRLSDYGQRSSNSRCKVFGHWFNSMGHFATGDMELSQKNGAKAEEAALDPAYSQFPKLTLGMVYLSIGQFQEAEDILQSVLNFCENREMGQISVLARLFLAPIYIAKGQMKQGLKMQEQAQHALIKNNRRVWYAQSEYILGKVYSQIATEPSPAFSILAKNIGFLVKNAPFAGKKAEEHFNKAIQLSKELGAKSILGLAYLDLGLFYKARNKNQQALECISEAINVFQGCGAEFYLKQAKDALESLND